MILEKKCYSLYNKFRKLCIFYYCIGITLKGVKNEFL